MFSRSGIQRGTHIVPRRLLLLGTFLKGCFMDGFRILNKESWLKMLNISENELKVILDNKNTAYNIIKKPKKGGYRTIYCINNESQLYILQNRIQKHFFCNIYLPECVYGFRAHYSYLDFLIPHISNNSDRCFLRLDIKDFFDSISIENIKSFIKYYIDEHQNLNDESQKTNDIDYILDSFIDLTTLNGKFIQGAVTSPAISNFSFRQLDIRILKYCQKLNICYTRYADDMLFSSESGYLHSKHFVNAIKAMLNDYGFSLNLNKTLKYRSEISLNGYVVGNDIRLSRNKMNKINELIFRLSNLNFGGFSSDHEKYHIKNQLAGYRSLLIQISRYVHDTKIKKKLSCKIQTIQELIIKHFDE